MPWVWSCSAYGPLPVGSVSTRSVFDAATTRAVTVDLKTLRRCSGNHPVRPLSVGQAPAAAERLVETDVGEKTVTANLRERVLRRVELLLGFEHFEVIRQPLAIASGRMLDGFLERPHGGVLSRLGLVKFAECGQRVRDLAECGEDRLLVLKLRLLPLRDGRAIKPERAAHVEERSAEHAGARPDRRRRSEERRAGDEGR